MEFLRQANLEDITLSQLAQILNAHDASLSRGLSLSFMVASPLTFPMSKKSWI